MIGTKFPSYFVRHPNKVAWLIHQYRAAYELCGTEYSDFTHDDEDVGLRRTLIDLDTKMLGECRRVFANAENTANRLAKYNGLAAEALYHPPPFADRLARGPYGDYVLFVGRLESIKRPDLAVRAMSHVDKPIRLVMVGEGTQRMRTEELAVSLGVADRIEFAGSLDERGLGDLYKGALAVVYCPFDEDYGYVTLESFLSHKPVITTTDAGGPLEFVEHETSGLVCQPTAEAVAGAINRLASDKALAARLGDAGYERARLVTWDGVIEKLVGVQSPESRVQQSRVSMKKLIIQIPCLNEADTLPSTLRDLPRAIAGIDTIEVLVIDDGSTDATVDVARAAGVEHIISLRSRRGLATAFTTGIDTALKLGADFIVNTDGDNQYMGADIAALVAPLVSGEADVVIGDRNVETLRHLSWTRKRLQHLGSWVVRQVSNTRVPDTTSGFRAYSREAALRMNIVSEFTYTLESIIQAGKKRMAIAHVPIRSNPKTRPSRLFDNVWVYIKRSASTIVRIYTMYEPFKVFTTIGLLTFGLGLAISCRFLYFYLNNDGSGHVQSLLLAAVLMIVGFQVLMIGLVADVISANRKLLEDLLYRVRSMELDGRTSPPRRKDAEDIR